MTGIGNSGRPPQETASRIGCAAPLYTCRHGLSSRAPASKSRLTTKNLYEFLRIFKALFQGKGAIFVQEAVMKRSMFWAGQVHILTPLNQQDNSASLVTVHLEGTFGLRVLLSAFSEVYTFPK